MADLQSAFPVGHGQEPSPSIYRLDTAAFTVALQGASDLDGLAAIAHNCDRCGLRAGCRAVVFGEGHPRARLLLVGEGPGATEDAMGRPFVGKAGELLDRILEAAGFHRAEVYIANVVMCRPPGNRVPTPEEVSACRPYLERRVALMDPPLIVALGATATRALLRPNARITQERGRWHRVDGRWVMPTYHPAALLRDPSKKKAVWDDFQLVREFYRRLS